MMFTEKQQEFLNNATHRWNIKSGATRSGKTYLDYYVIPKRIRSMKGKDGLIVLLGNTKGTLQRNIIEPLQKIWGTNMVSDIKSNNTAILFGEKVHCLGADKVSQVDVLRGTSIKYCYGDEVVTWNQEVFDMLKSRLDKPYSCFDGTCNPDNPRHWFRKFMSSNADVYLQEYCIDDNRFLDKTVVEELKKEYYGTVLYDRYILGKWVIAEGLVYQNFDQKRTVIDYSEQEVDDDAEYYISCDYGITNPFSALLWKIKGDKAICIDEYYFNSREEGRRKTDEEHYISLEKLAGNHYIEYIVIDPSATSMKETIARHDRFLFANARNDVLNGIANTASIMNTDHFFISSKCKSLIDEFQLYRWNSKSDKDEVMKENDHAMDAMRYFVNTVLVREFDFFDWKQR